MEKVEHYIFSNQLKKPDYVEHKKKTQMKFRLFTSRRT